MKTKRITALLMALTLTAALSACGNKTKSNTPTNEKVKAASIDEKPDDTTASAVTAMNEATEEAIDVAIQTEQETNAAEPNTAAAESDKADSTTPTTTKAKTKSSESNTAKSNSSTYNAPAANTTSHQHSWKDHTATEQVWVSNMVTVDDYEWQQVDNTYVECNCGFRIYDRDIDYNRPIDDIANDPNCSIEAHMKVTYLANAQKIDPSIKTLKEANQRGIPYSMGECVSWHGGGSVDYVKVKVGSHQEDQGHYETRTYVDYRYCDCGARQ